MTYQVADRSPPIQGLDHHIRRFACSRSDGPGQLGDRGLDNTPSFDKARDGHTEETTADVSGVADFDLNFPESGFSVVLGTNPDCVVDNFGHTSAVVVPNLDGTAAGLSRAIGVRALVRVVASTRSAASSGGRPG